MKKIPVLSALISHISPENFIENVFALAHGKQSSYICFANVHMVMEAHKDPQFKTVLNEADIAVPDGRPLSLFMKWFKNAGQQRICGMDFFPILLREAEKRGKSVYFYGSTEKVLGRIVDKAREEFPLLRIAGRYSPPFRYLTRREDIVATNNINHSGADLVFVSLGCPRQEKWMARHRGRIHACMLGVGQAYLVYAGMEKRLPAWMRNLSLEWLYRLYQEPGRLWKRYLVTVPSFIFLSLWYAGQQVPSLLFRSRKTFSRE